MAVNVGYHREWMLGFVRYTECVIYCTRATSDCGFIRFSRAFSDMGGQLIMDRGFVQRIILIHFLF